MPSRVQYGHYENTPLRNHPYPYVRAQRMKSAGASNKKIVRKGKENPILEILDTQIPHSAKSLSRKSLSSAKRIQSAKSRCMSAGTTRTDPEETALQPEVRTRKMSLSAPAGGRRKSSAARSVASVRLGTKTEDSEASEDHGDLARRVSWGFESGYIPNYSQFGLHETKTLLRSQIRSKGRSIFHKPMLYRLSDTSPSNVSLACCKSCSATLVPDVIRANLTHFVHQFLSIATIF